MAERVTKQIGAPDEIIAKLKQRAVEKGKDLQEILDEAILDFFEQRDDIKKSERRAPDYFVSPTDAKDFNVRISKSIAAKVEKAADEDAATSRRLIYTGLVTYVRRHKL
jgi:hypothetical protein